jgi:hypothetical protein
LKGSGAQLSTGRAGKRYKDIFICCRLSMVSPTWGFPKD